MLILGQIIKIHSGKYFVKTESEIIECSAKGALKIKSDGIFTGDFVEFENGVVKSVKTRKNRLIRPSVANVDCMVIVVANPPEPDLYLFDKLISTAHIYDIPFSIVVNKVDFDLKTANIIKENYKDAVENIFFVSAKTGEGFEELSNFLKGKLVVFSGQSAVGKTSIVNRLFGESKRTGEVSVKTQKGKQTTTVSEITERDGIRVIDTPGFTAMDIDIEEDVFPWSYPEFSKYSGECKFADCRHLKEPDCMVRKAYENGLINKDRYKRYCEIYKEIKEKDRYDKKR
ncbi:MAG: ribosome small subunit-dependent GTPase A [Clostridia bacterium]|nr:ribosome small subunit-dependent GTPase A [Clostridia bacterium]